MSVIVRSFASLILPLALCLSAGEPNAPEKPSTPAAQYRGLLTEFNTVTRGHWQAKTDDDRAKILAAAVPIPKKILELTQANPRDDFVLDALTQVLSQEYWLNAYTSHSDWGKDSPQVQAIAQLLRDHLQSSKLGETCKRVQFGLRQECETFLRTVLEKNPHRDVQGLACLRLAQFLLNRMDKVELLREQPEIKKRFESLYGKEYLDALQRQDPAAIVNEAAALYEQAIEKYGDVGIPYNDKIVGKVADTAKTELREVRELSVGKTAPDIEGVDQDAKPTRLSEYRGKVVLLYFWTEY